MIRLLLLALVLALAACGKVGPNTPPGPPDKVIYGNLQYPAQ
jgi:predicted small lipoprotein YifL